MHKRYLVLGIVSLVLGMFFFIYSYNTFLIFNGINFIFIISIFAIIFGLVFVVCGVTESDKDKKNLIEKSDKMNCPIDVLKMRFARGEVTKIEFEDMRKDLEG